MDSIIKIFWVLIFSQPLVAFSSVIDCKVPGYDDYSVEISLVNKRAAFFDNDIWTILEQVENKNSFSTMLLFEETNGDVVVGFDTAETSPKQPWVGFNGEVIELTSCSFSSTSFSGIDKKEVIERAIYTLDTKETNSSGCLPKFVIKNDVMDKRFYFSSGFEDDAPVFLDYYFENVGMGKVKEIFATPSGNLMPSWEENTLSEENNILVFNSLVQHRGFGPSGTIRDFSLTVENRKAFYIEDIRITTPKTYNRCSYTKD